MQAVRYHEHGDADVLRVDEVDRPAATGNEVVVEVRAAGVNPVDTYFRSGSYRPFTLPMIPGSDAAGEVVEVSDRVEGFDVGDRVYATGLGRDRQGTYAEYVAVPEDRLAHLPDSVGFSTAAGAALVGVTAWRALIDHAGLELAEWALIHGGSGGVGHLAVQLADAAGARVVATAAPDYHDHVARLGADVTLDYGRDDLADAVLEATGGVDVALDHRLDEYLPLDGDVIDPGGRVVGIGENDPAAGFENVSAVRSKDVELTLMSMFNTPDFAAVLKRLAYLLREGDLAVHAARRYDLDDAAAAHRAVTGESFLGKLVIEP